MARQGSFLRSNEFLFAGDWLTSPAGLFSAFMQADANLCVVRGADPQHHNGVVWCRTDQGQPLDEYFLAMQADGNLTISRGQPKRSGEAVWWRTDQGQPMGNYFLAMQDDGNLCIYKGTPEENEGFLWGTGAAPVIVYGHQAIILNNVFLCAVDVNIWWNNQDGSENQHTGNLLHPGPLARRIQYGDYATIELNDPYLGSGEIKEGATCWIKVEVVAGCSGSSNGNFIFKSDAPADPMGPRGRNVYYDVEGSIQSIDINGPYDRNPQPGKGRR